MKEETVTLHWTISAQLGRTTSTSISSPLTLSFQTQLSEK